MKLLNLIANSPAGPVLAIAFVVTMELLVQFMEAL